MGQGNRVVDKNPISKNKMSKKALSGKRIGP
jgi:hypothetical protein